MERSILSWKEPFEVGKVEMKLERIALVGKHERKLERIALVGKLQMKLETTAKVKKIEMKLERSDNSMTCRENVDIELRIRVRD